jgi:hypothetical protein
MPPGDPEITLEFQSRPLIKVDRDAAPGSLGPLLTLLARLAAGRQADRPRLRVVADNQAGEDGPEREKARRG